MKLPPFLLERFFARHEFEARYLLCGSDCQSMSIRELLSLEPGAREKFHDHWLGYTESTGSRSLRREIARGYAAVTPEQVLVHAGAEEAIFLFMHAALEPGDHLVVHAPCYQSLYEVARGIGCDVTPWQAREENGWALDPADLPRLVRGGTKAIVINVPHNPTGYLMGEGEFRDINRFADTHGIALFSDEVYRGLEYDDADRLPPACSLGESAISLGVVSKTFGLAGLRIGWVATRNSAVLSRMAAMKDYTTICASAPSEFLAELALRHGESIAARNRGIIAANLALLDGFFARHADRFSWRRPKAGPIAFPRLCVGDAEAFCSALLQSSGVLLLPGTVYGDTGNHFRIGFGRMNMPEALARMEEYVESQPLIG
jgi:aspartate/methionine/tyrosine aminotransferase